MESEKTKSWIYKCLTAQKSDFSSRNLEKEDIANWTHEFLIDLRCVFEHFIKAFDDLKREDISAFPKPPTEEIREKLKGSIFLYDLADQKGFMLFRKGYRLIFSYVRPGRIRVRFLKQQPFSETENFVDAFINAITDDTMSVNWVHENHKGFVDLNVLAHYYMRRFLQTA